MRALDEVVSDEELWARGAFVRLPSDEFGTVIQVSPTPRLSATPGRIRTLAHRPGADAATILREIGYQEKEIARLRTTHVIAD
jgi:crotonobetainyl-CoA:carnitine CoA-transferase CaiB-like acyl-CoA transferase